MAAENAGCDRGGVPVVRGLSVIISPGEAVQLFGPNGSGKTSLLSLFAGIVAPAEGAVRWRRADIEKKNRPFSNSIFFLGHETAVKPALTAFENLVFWAKLYGVKGADADGRARSALARVGLAAAADMRAGRLSAGQRRRIDLARGDLVDREVWLLDEPSSSLDSDGARIAGEMISDHLLRGGIAIIATHALLDAPSRRLELHL